MPVPIFVPTGKPYSNMSQFSRRIQRSADNLLLAMPHSLAQTFPCRNASPQHARRAGGLELAGAVQLLLFLGVVHFGVEINLGDFERLVTEPALDLHQVESRAQPVGSRSFP